MKVSINTRKHSLKYGSEYFSPLFWSCKFEIIGNMIKNLQAFLCEFVTEPESGDNCFIFQSSFHNTNIREGGMRKKRMLVPCFYGWPSDLQIGVNELFKMQNFINFEEFMTLLREILGKNQLQDPFF